MNRTILPPPSGTALRISSAPMPRLPRLRARHQPVPAIVIQILGVMLLFITAAAIVSMLSGCGGQILHAARFTREQLDPPADEWRAIGAELNIVYDNSIAGDTISYERKGWLQQNRDIGPDMCAYTPVGGVLVWEQGLSENRNILIDAGCAESGIFTLHNIISHELAHYLGLHHLPDGEVGIMAPTGMPGPVDANLTCADKINWTHHEGLVARCEVGQ